MPALIGLFLRMVGLSIVPLGWKLLRGLGFAAISYIGIDAALDKAKGYAFAQLGGLPGDWIAVLGMLKIDVCLNILFSAYIARALLAGMNKAGSKTSMNWTPKE
ncbi:MULTISPECIES: DUF2523 domain-containing protein [Pseudomonas syringae group]|uniref:DUF2523 domain-containing protein n=1 Tax=Pseudomonas syringae group TaxID=136849 RepID=UPI000CD26728|nr:MULTISPECIES: DUF2523 domain-containing protein [Pseudomonas syringae group]POD06707.1 hypothetical protein BKM22_00815 [Pseudomonas amygdali pv. morsprunorum]POD48944.1 hypothetical protein BKM16_00815 [Pseudomonas amygdali pv. morsprunorum]POD54239.1 hypothetical protein BKM02_00820 [Pseudomonas amygdali pv. morsprunorum]POY77244.1 hypothetical protein BKM09_030410 [Pseudomonas amygdali pv. morsprunorum]RMN41250.1 hypothetical protein ALQ60_200274 [Pseudomonas syringae pv. papulans]